MSNALAISGVTAILQHYFGILYGNVHDQLPSVTVSCLAPDQVQQTLTGASGSGSQVNLFLHQVTHNAAWRNMDMPSMSSTGMTRLKSPPLALDLHYLLTVYGSEYWQAEALLGYALMMLHEAPVLTRDDIRHALAALPALSGTALYPNPTLISAIATSGLADQIEMIKITPATLGREELAWLWTALKADYRPTFPFLVSVVLLQPVLQTSLALPVLVRKLQAQPMQRAYILEVVPPKNQSAAQPGDPVTITGEFLKGATQVVLNNPRLTTQPPPISITATNNSLTFKVPVSAQYPAGMYGLVAQFLDPVTTSVLQATNSLPFAVAPILPAQAAVVSTQGVAPHQFKLVSINTFSPPAQAGQVISLSLNNLAGTHESMSATAVPFTGTVSSLDFQFDPSLPTGALLGRLVVDGVASQVQFDTFPFPPKFTGPLVTV